MPTYNTDLQKNNSELDQILQAVNNLPESGVPVWAFGQERLLTTAVSDGVNKVVLTAEQDGTPFNLKYARVRVVNQNPIPLETNVSATLGILNSTNKLLTWVSIASEPDRTEPTPANCEWLAASYVDHGMWTGYFSFSIKDLNHFYQPYWMPLGKWDRKRSFADFPGINTIQFAQVLPEGFKIEVYGVSV